MSLTAAASVILLRPSPSGCEVLLMRRQARGSWADAYVFPGGKLEASDRDLAHAALRELFEEAGVLLAHGAALSAEARHAARERLIAGEPLAALTSAAGLTLDATQVVPWARWQTPPVEPRRFDATFFVAVVPDDQEASAHAHEHVEHRWVAPRAALAAAAEGALRLPPPQLRTLWELVDAGDAAPAILAAARRRAPDVRPLMPRALGDGDAVHLVFPWDPAYERAPLAAQEGTPWPAAHPHAGGPSRVLRTADGSWRLGDG